MRRDYGGRFCDDVTRNLLEIDLSRLFDAIR